ncbi:MAG: aromatic aminobenezylarsenical efflux permease ArsG family transporter [Acidobacteriota bacterium]
MTEALAVAGGALWLGVLTSISPCPLATNIAALSFVGRHVGSPRMALLSGVLYTLGRTLAYVTLAALVIAALLSIVEVSATLQKVAARALGPVLIVVGVALLGVIPLPSFGGGVNAKIERLAAAGVWGAVPLGAAFALAFCPVSAALFFGSLVPIATSHGSPVMLPALYGVGTAIPVLGFAVLLAAGRAGLGTAYERLRRIERWARPATGVVFILAGVYETLRGVFHLV